MILELNVGWTRVIEGDVYTEGGDVYRRDVGRRVTRNLYLSIDVLEKDVYREGGCIILGGDATPRIY